MSKATQLDAASATRPQQPRRGTLSFSWAAWPAMALGLVAGCDSRSAALAGVADGSVSPGDAPIDGALNAPDAQSDSLAIDLPSPSPPPDQLGLGATFNLYLGGWNVADNAVAGAFVIFFHGTDCPLNTCRNTSEAGGTVTVNGNLLPRQLADWGVSYVSRGLPDPADGVYTFRVDYPTRTVVRTARTRRITLDLPANAQLQAGSGPITVTWSPAFDSSKGIEVRLNGCGRADLRSATPASATFMLELLPPDAPGSCQAILTVGQRTTEPIGPPFLGGSVDVQSFSSRAVTVMK